MDRGHRQIEHTADIALEIWAPSEITLLEEGGRALIEILTEGEIVAPRTRRALRIDGVDREDRFVRALNEVLVAAIVDGFLFSTIERMSLEGDVNEVVVLGEADAIERIKVELKSVTYHDLFVREEQDGRWRARVVVDV